mgnify:CR=1 FL=1
MHKWFGKGIPKGRRLIIAFVILLIVVGGVIAWQILHTKNNDANVELFNPYKDEVKRLESQKPPADPMLRAIFYGQLAQNYQQIGDNQKALVNYLQVQSIIDKNGLNDQYVYYHVIADTYRKSGDKSNAKRYYQLQLAYLKAFLKKNPDDSATASAIKAVEEEIKSL